MNLLHRILLASLAAMILGVVILVHLDREQGAEIRLRYAQMTAAISADDTNAILALVAPQFRKEFDDSRLMRMEGIAKPLRSASKVIIIGKDATVWPSPNWYYCGFFPIGDTVEMTRVSGNWFFTGKVHLD